MGVPRVWEKMMEKIKEVSSQTGLLKRKTLSWAMSATLEQNLSCSNRWVPYLGERINYYKAQTARKNKSLILCFLTLVVLR